MEVMSYTLKDLAELEKKHPITVRGSDRYLKIRIETKSTVRRAKLGLQKKSYSYRYVRIEDILNAYKDKIDFTFLPKKKG